VVSLKAKKWHSILNAYVSDCTYLVRTVPSLDVFKAEQLRGVFLAPALEEPVRYIQRLENVGMSAGNIEAAN